MYKQTIIIDNGSLYSKMGFGGNLEPTIVIPTAILNIEKKILQVFQQKVMNIIIILEMKLSIRQENRKIIN